MYREIQMLKLRKFRVSRGFTLIELLVVVVIIGILAAVALPNMLGQTDKARLTEAAATISSINTGQEAYYLENRSIYESIGDVDAITIPASNNTVLPVGTEVVVTSNAGDPEDFRTKLGVNITGTTARWKFATKATTSGSINSWRVGAQGLGSNENLGAYAVRGNNKTYFDLNRES
jgi:type IV pilus assembly protein PilA